MDIYYVKDTKSIVKLFGVKETSKRYNDCRAVAQERLFGSGMFWKIYKSHIYKDDPRCFLSLVGAVAYLQEGTGISLQYHLDGVEKARLQLTLLDEYAAQLVAEGDPGISQ